MYNLSICCVDGSIYGFICDDKVRLANFLTEYDHEGSSISLVKHEGSEFTEIDFERIYSELGL
jgi:hypothetical protein